MGSGNRTKNRPYRIIPLSTIEERIFIAHGNAITIVKETYKSVSKKATFIDKKGKWDAFVYNVLSGSTRGNPKLTLEEAKKRIFEIHGDEVVLIENTYKDTKNKAIFKHTIHGEWPAVVSSILRGGNHPQVAVDNLKLTKAEFEEKLSKIHGDILRISWDTYVDTHTMATFVDKVYGNFLSVPYRILAGGSHPARSLEKIRATNLKRYGVEHSSQNRGIALKTAKSANNSTIMKHWKTNEEIVCRASYEPKVVTYLNANKIEYLWQPKIFTTTLLTKSGRSSTYCPDIFLINENKWIEVKGFFRDDARAKWDWFQRKYPNSELWDEKKLKEMGIL